MASKGFPGLFPAGLTTSYVTIGAAKKEKPSRGNLGMFPGNLCIGFTTIGGVQKEPLTPPASDGVSEIIIVG